MWFYESVKCYSFASQSVWPSVRLCVFHLSSINDKWITKQPFPLWGGGCKMHLERREIRLRMISSQNICQIDCSYKVESIHWQWKCKLAEFLHRVTVDFFIFLLLYIRKMKGSFNANFLVWTVSQIDLLPCQFLIFSPTFSLVKKINKSNSIEIVFAENLQQERHRTGYCSLK